MALREECERLGHWFFRHRSLMPLLLLPLFVLTFAFSQDLPNALIHTRGWELFCFGVSLIGTTIRIWTIGYVPPGTSGRNTHQQIADALNTEGPYSIVRHPLYLGNFFILLGIALWPALWWFALLFTTLFALYYERIMVAEEAFLRQKFGQQFLKWAEQTPAFFPRFTQYRPATRPFSLRKVLRQEYPGWMNLSIAFLTLEFLYTAFHDASFHPEWGYLAVTMILFGLCLRWLKYHSRWLSEL